MSLVRDGATVAAICAGVLFFLAGTVGLLRFPDTLSRLHALTKADNLGLGLIVLGTALQAEGILAALRLIVIWLLVLLSGSAVSQLTAVRAYRAARQS
jgi:multicomponent Na+:H+ antiporter subunit G